MYEYNAKLLKVVDGDTIDAMVDLGFSTFTKQRIRLYEIDTPEVRTRDLEEKKAGLKAKKRLIELLEQNNGTFVLKSHGLGKYGRCLGEIFTNNRSINQILLKEGLAVPYN